MRKLKDGLGILFIFLFVLSFSISCVIFFTPLYKATAIHLELPEMLGMNQETLWGNYDHLMDYLIKPWVTELNMPNFPSSESGLFHFWEVKNLFLLNHIILAISGIWAGIYLYQTKKQARTWTLIRPFYLMIFIPIVMLFLIFLNFDTVFVLFHELAFNNDMWIFNASTDPIILALPQEFFMYCFIAVFGLIELLFVTGYVWSKKVSFKKPNRK